MFKRNAETGKLVFNNLAADILFDEIFEKAENEEEFQFIFSHLFKSLYEEAICMALERGIQNFEPDVEL